VLFGCGLVALAAKLLGWVRERAALRTDLLPAWNGQPVAITEATALRDRLAPGTASTWLGRRIQAILDFLHGRGAATQLDDQMRTLADNDVMELDGSYSLVRFITWAIPILGFLGTVVGITAAVAGVTPEVLEQSLDGVTSGLATAFDTTALALLLTMILMFGSFLVERLENGMLQQIDAYVDAELAHRFERAAAEASPMLEAMRLQSTQLQQATERLVERQAALWSQSLDQAQRQWTDAGPRQIATLQRGLEQALDVALQRHTQQLRQTEQDFLGRTAALVAGLAAAADKLGQHAEALASVQEHEAHLVRLQEALQQNLAALAGAGAFEQAVQSLTAAIHLLTTRVHPAQRSQAA